jgi:hypothetical protein
VTEPVAVDYTSIFVCFIDDRKIAAQCGLDDMVIREVQAM